MKNIIIFSNASGYGGAEKSLELLVNEIIKKNKVIIFVENDDHKRNLSYENMTNLEIISLRKGKSIYITALNVYNIYNRIKNIKDKYFLTNTNKAALYSTILYYLKIIDPDKTIVYIRDFQWRYAQIIKRFAKYAKIALPSKTLYENKKYIASIIGNNNRSVITNDPIEIPCYKKMVTLDFRGYILLLGNISRLKGVIYLLKAYIKSKYCKKKKLLIVGKVIDEVYYNEMKLFINQNEITEYVEFIPYTDNVSKYYYNASIVINSSIAEFGGPETFGRTIVEAWSYKKAIISFNVGGPKYIVDNNVNGILVAEKDIVQLAAAIDSLLDDEERSALYGEAGYKKVLRKFTKEKVVKSLYKMWNLQ